MRQQGDVKTIELFPLPRPRGRPPTGKAKSAAQRQAEFRVRKKLEGQGGS